jgi:hypothetical protein
VYFSFDTAEYVTEHDNVANLIIFLELVASNVEIEDYISIDNNILTENNTLIISDTVNCNLENLSEKETEEVEEVWKTINNLKTYFKNKKNEIALSMVANL